jgi:hypothetical protein
MNISAPQAYYIKLGEGGTWEADCLNGGYMRVGFNEIPHELCLANNWAKVKTLFKEKKKGTDTRYATELERFYTSSPEILWITFSDRKLLWGFAEGKAYEVREDLGTYKQRKIKGGWRDKDIKGTALDIGRISSRLTQVRGYMGTICEVKELEYLCRKINGEELGIVQNAKAGRENLLNALVPLIQHLTWADFEILVDMVFTAGGWRRIGAVGKTEKDIDLELQQPVTRELVMVQVKSKCSPQTIRDISVNNLGKDQYKQIFVVTHSFDGKRPDGIDERIKIIDVERLAPLVLNAGLADWLIEKSK